MPELQPEPQRAFAAELRELRMKCGKPTEQEIARQMNCGRTTVSDLLNGRRFPTWDQTQALVGALLRDESAKVDPRWNARWLATSRALDTLRHGQAPFADQAVRPPQEAFSVEQTATSLISTTWYRDNPEFYRAGTRYMRAANAEIRVTYVRQYPPTVFTTPASAEYFATILAWARQETESQRSVRRVIGVPHKEGVPDPAMLTWIRRHREETADILNYEANVLPWHTAGDGLNIALVDEDVAFLAFSGGGRQKLNGFSVADPTFVGYFIRHFDQLWATLEPLDDYLRRIGS
jgi:transcriptional regulator with XRE-family HTH domain